MTIFKSQMRHIRTLLAALLLASATLYSYATESTAETTAASTVDTPSPAAASPAQLFAAANRHHEAGEYAEAAQALTELTNTYPAPAAYYNLGNAYFRLGQYGQAIAAYEKAHALSPAQPDVLANLNRAKEAARLAAVPVTRWEQYARALSPNNWTILLAVSFWATLGLWLIPGLYRRQHGIWRPSLLALSIAVLLFSAAGLYPWRQLARSGTVLQADTPLLLAPVATSPVQTYAQAGQAAQRISTHGGFERIRLPDGTEGWVTKAQFATTWNLR